MLRAMRAGADIQGVMGACSVRCQLAYLSWNCAAEPSCFAACICQGRGPA